MFLMKDVKTNLPHYGVSVLRPTILTGPLQKVIQVRFSLYKSKSAQFVKVVPFSLIDMLRCALLLHPG